MSNIVNTSWVTGITTKVCAEHRMYFHVKYLLLGHSLCIYYFDGLVVYTINNLIIARQAVITGLLTIDDNN